MNPFERTYQTDPQREMDVPREKISQERSDAEYLARIESLSVGKRRKTADTTEKNAQDTSESPKKATKKVPAKRNKPAMARLQKKL